MAPLKRYVSRKMLSADSTWTKLCTYTTVKKCQIVDAKIALSHKAVMLGVFLYIVLNLILSHGYMLQEPPSAVFNAYVDQADYHARASELRASPPWYCSNSSTDFVFSDAWRYESNACDFDLDVGEILTKTESAVFITTYFQDTPLDADAATAAGVRGGNYFVPGVDQMRLVYDHQVSASWGASYSNPRTTFSRRGASDGSALLTSPAGSDVSLKLADLLAVAGVSLDDANDGGPLYRLSGAHVHLSTHYTNMDSARPFARDVAAKTEVDYTRGVWTSLGPKIVHKRDASGGWHAFQRYHYALRVSFVAGGLLGTTHFFTLLVNLAVATGLLGVAVTVVDAASEFLVSNFDDMKYDDRNDWMTLEALKEYALREGILDRFAEKTGMELLEDDVMRGVIQRNKASARRREEEAAASEEARGARSGGDGWGGGGWGGGHGGRGHKVDVEVEGPGPAGGGDPPAPSPAAALARDSPTAPPGAVETPKAAVALSKLQREQAMFLEMENAAAGGLSR